LIQEGKAVVANGMNFPDALAVSSLAAYQKLPILLTDTNVLPAATQAALSELGIESSVVIGGTGVVSETVKQKLPSAVRYSGKNRYETSLAVARGMNADTGTIFLASGENFPDALAGSVFAAWTNSPIILVNGNNPPDKETYDSLLNQKTRNIYILGGTGVIPDSLVASMDGVYFSASAEWYDWQEYKS